VAKEKEIIYFVSKNKFKKIKLSYIIELPVFLIYEYIYFMTTPSSVFIKVDTLDRV